MKPEQLVPIVLLVALTFGAGLRVNREHLIAILEDAGLLAKVFLANFIIVPFLGWLLYKIFALPTFIATGFLLMAIAPGVPFVLMGARKKGGSLGLAIALALLLPLISIITVPITAAFVLPVEAQAQLPMTKFAVTLLLFQALPLLIGIAVVSRFPELAARLSRISIIISLVALLALLIVLVPRLGHDVVAVYGSHGMLAILCLVILSAITGWLLGGPADEDRHTLTIGTVLRNIGLSATIATATFPGTAVVTSALVYLLIQGIVAAIIGAYFKRTSQRATA